MARAGSVEREIRQAEGFRVEIRHLDGKNVRSDREDLPGYPFDRKMPGEKTVSDWIRRRFTPKYAGFRVTVLDGRGRPVHGATLLRNVRDSYKS